MSEAERAARPESEGRRRAAAWMLGISVAATMVGMLIAVYRGDGSSINAFLFLDMELSHESAAQIERTVLVATTLAAVVAVLWPRAFLLVPVALYLLAEAVAGYYVRGYAFSELTPVAHTLRYVAPLALVLVARSGRIERRRPDAAGARSAAFSLMGGAWLLRLGLAAVFFAHGYEALRLHPAFIDLIITSGQNLLGMRIEESTASMALRIIGAVDMVVAALLLIRPWRPVLAWMLFWGLLTAASRMTSYGWGAHTDVLLRFTHFAVPLVLMLITARRSAPGREDEDREPANL